MGKGQRDGAGTAAGIPRGRPESALFNGPVLHSSKGNYGISVLRLAGVFPVQKALCPTLRAAGTEVVSPVQRRVAGEFLGGNGAVHRVPGAIHSGSF